MNHSRSAEQAATYKVEPYVVAADVYAVAPHTGRGGWTWYTGSAGWMYRLILESLLGLRLQGDTLHLTPCVPKDWPAFSIHYRYGDTMHHIIVTQARGGGAGPVRTREVRFDGVLQNEPAILLRNDGHDHTIEVALSPE